MFKGILSCCLLIVCALIAHATLSILILESNQQAILECQSSLFPYEIVMTVSSLILCLLIIFTAIALKLVTGNHYEDDYIFRLIKLILILLFGLFGWSLYIYLTLNNSHCLTIYQDKYPDYLKLFYATFWFYIGIKTSSLIVLYIVLPCYARRSSQSRIENVVEEIKHDVQQLDQSQSNSIESLEHKPTSGLSNSAIPRLDYYSHQKSSRLKPQFSLDSLPMGFTDIDISQ
jgi:hypothetical protein